MRNFDFIDQTMNKCEEICYATTNLNNEEIMGSSNQKLNYREDDFGDQMSCFDPCAFTTIDLQKPTVFTRTSFDATDNNLS